MLGLRIVSGCLPGIEAAMDTCLTPIVRQDGLIIDGDDLFHHWQNGDGGKYYVFGNVVGLRSVDGNLTAFPFIKQDADRIPDEDRIPEVEGRFVLVKLCPDGAIEVWTDQFGRVDIYWQKLPDGIVLGTSLDLLPVSRTGGTLDPVGVAHSLTVYGSRPARRHTLYKGIRRLGVNQGIRIFHDRYELLERSFEPGSIADYGEPDLDRYTEIFLEAIRARASDEGNVVSLSSGWDSTSILACLVHLFGRHRTRAVIGRMRYSERSGVINQFEIDRAKAFADYFGVGLEIIDLDYRTKGIEYFETVKEFFRSHQMASLSSLGQWILAEGVARTSGGRVLFTGEMSDAVHNLGFSQFFTIFHPASLEFREYCDKMASYLFGPTFLRQLQAGTHEQDPVWQIFKQRNPDTVFDEPERGGTAVIRQLLASFFLRGGRLPFYSLDNAYLLTPEGREFYSRESERVYLDDIYERVTADTLYAWYLHLYNSFHWQGATVLSRDYMADVHGLRCSHPFQDSALIDFLSGMPETWGRGLDFNPTKYPLKWMLRNRIDYPYHLQVGPHAYTYDVDPGFSILGEIFNASSLKDVFIEALRSGEFVGSLDEELFDHSYIDRIVSCYLDGGELRGREMTDLGVLAMHSAVGVYGQ